MKSKVEMDLVVGYLATGNSVYDLIDMFVDEAKLAEYVKDLNSPEFDQSARDWYYEAGRELRHNRNTVISG